MSKATADTASTTYYDNLHLAATSHPFGDINYRRTFDEATTLMEASPERAVIIFEAFIGRFSKEITRERLSPKQSELCGNIYYNAATCYSSLAEKSSTAQHQKDKYSKSLGRFREALPFFERQQDRTDYNDTVEQIGLVEAANAALTLPPAAVSHKRKAHNAAAAAALQELASPIAASASSSPAAAASAQLQHGDTGNSEQQKRLKVDVTPQGITAPIVASPSLSPAAAAANNSNERTTQELLASMQQQMQQMQQQMHYQQQLLMQRQQQPYPQQHYPAALSPIAHLQRLLQPSYAHPPMPPLGMPLSYNAAVGLSSPMGQLSPPSPMYTRQLLPQPASFANRAGIGLPSPNGQNNGGRQ